MKPSAPATFDEQCDALRSGCGVVDLAGWSSITLTGDDRQTFLNNFCTNDIKRLAAGESREAFFTNVKGKIVGHGVVSCRENELVIIGVPRQAPRLIEHLDRYIIREDVQLRDTTSERSYVLVAGSPSACDRFAECLSERPAGGTPLQCDSWNLVGSEFTGLVEMPPGEVPAFLADLSERGFVIAQAPAFTTARIEAGMPLFGVDFDDQNLPQEVGRNEQAISFIKGCYLGQETVARIDALGHVNQQLAGVRFSGADLPDVGATLTAAGKTVGHVMSATFSPQLQAALGLAMVRRPHNEVGSRLESSYGPCEVVTVPVSTSRSE
jgi:folate-binding protein YgfZ